MKLRTYLLTAVSMYVVAVLVACSNKSADAPVATITCPPGSNYSLNGNCFDQYGQIIGGVGLQAGWGNRDLGYMAETERNYNMTVTNVASYKAFLEIAHSVCNRAHISKWDANCDAWIGGYFMVGLQSFAGQNNAVRLTFFVQPNPYMMTGNSLELPSIRELFTGFFGYPVYGLPGTARQLFQVDAIVSAINASKGFEARGYGPLDTASNRSLIQLQVATGRILEQNLPFKLFFQGQELAAGSLGMCQNANCE